MEAQLSPMYVPTYCNYGTAYPPTSPFPKPQPSLYPQLIPSPPFLVPSGPGQIYIQMQQILPIITPEATLIPSCTENLTQQVISCYPNNQIFDPAAVVPLNLHQKIHQINSVSHADSTLTKTLRKKKVSPSAKRRSRLRLIAFLEAKKEKCGSLSPEQNCDATISPADTANEKTIHNLETAHFFPEEENRNVSYMDTPVEIKS